MFRPVGKPRVAEEIVQQLRGLILRGEYAVGDKLPPERKLAEELGVNRASLREAIKSLEHMGLVKTRQGDGTRVLDFMQTAGVELVSHLIPGDGMPNLDVLTDVLDFRRWFGREVSRLAAERASAEDVKKLEGIAEQASDPQLDMNELLKVDFEFYVAMAHVGRNRVMQLLINTIRSAVLVVRAVLRAVQSAGAGRAQAPSRPHQGDRDQGRRGRLEGRRRATCARAPTSSSRPFARRRNQAP